MENKNNIKNSNMQDILNKAKGTTSNKSYEEADKKETVIAEVKTPKKAGRAKVIDKKKPRQSYFNDEEYSIIESAAEEMGLTAKSFMEKGIKDLLVKVTGQTLKQLIEKKNQ